MGPAEKLVPEFGIMVSNNKCEISPSTPNSATLTRTAEPRAPMSIPLPKTTTHTAL